MEPQDKKELERLLAYKADPDLALQQEVADLTDTVKDIAEALKGVPVRDIEALSGQDGYSPVKGEDYYTEDEMRGMHEEIQKNVVANMKGELELAKDEMRLELSPIKGIDYTDGINGRDGIDGITPVKYADYFTDEDVNEIVLSSVEYLEALEGDAKLDASALKNLEKNIDPSKLSYDFLTLDYKQLRNVPKPEKGSGGGAGARTVKWLNDITNADSATVGQILAKRADGRFNFITASGTGDMLVATYDAAGIAEQLVGLTAAQTLTNKTLTSPVLNTSVSGSAVLDEDDMASDSNTQLATQQSIKAYVDASASGIADGDKGDITVSVSGSVWTIDNDVVSYAKMQNVSATDKLLGRSTAGAGDVEEIACTAFARTILDDADAAAVRSTIGAGAGDMAAATYDAAGVSEQLAGLTAAQTLTNKTIDADNNTLSNIGIAEFDTDTADMVDLYIGACLDSPAVTVASNGTTITLTLEKSGTGDIRMVFSDGVHTHDCTPADTVSLNAGTDTSPQINYIYIPQSTKTLTAATGGFPAAEHVPVATVHCQSAASLQTDGAYKVHAWTDHVKGSSDSNGHLAHLNYWIRSQNATWTSGAALTPTVGAGQFDIATAAGVVLQLHQHDFPAFDTATGSDVYVANDFTTPYKAVGDLLLASVGEDANGTTLGDAATDFYNLVIWGAVNEASADCKLFVNVPDGAYGSDVGSQASLDLSATAVYDIPAAFKGVGFLIARLTVQENGGTYTIIQNEDLRGKFPSTGAGGGGGGGGGVTTFTQLTDTPSAYTSQGLKLVQVASGETALEFTTAPTAATTNMTDDTDKRFMSDAQETVLNNTSGTNTGDEDTASITALGALMDSELTDLAAVKATSDASIADTDTGTSTTAFVTPDGLQGSIRNLRFIDFIVVEPGTDVATGTDKITWSAPFACTIVQSDSTPDYFAAYTTTAGTTGTMVVDIHKNGTTIMTTNKLDIETTEKDTTTAATQPDLTTTTLAAGDIITIDIDAVHTTAAKGLVVRMAVRPD